MFWKKKGKTPAKVVTPIKNVFAVFLMFGMFFSSGTYAIAQNNGETSNEVISNTFEEDIVASDSESEGTKRLLLLYSVPENDPVDTQDLMD